MLAVGDFMQGHYVNGLLPPAPACCEMNQIFTVLIEKIFLLRVSLKKIKFILTLDGKFLGLVNDIVLPLGFQILNCRREYMRVNDDLPVVIAGYMTEFVKDLVIHIFLSRSRLGQHR